MGKITKNYFKNVHKEYFKFAKTFLDYIQKSEYNLSKVLDEYAGHCWMAYQLQWHVVFKEYLTWVGYVLNPDNAVYFLVWVFDNYPNIYDQMKTDLEKNIGEKEDGNG